MFKSAVDLEEALRVGTVAPEDMVIEPQPATGLKGGDTPRNLTAVEIAALRADLQFVTQLPNGNSAPVSVQNDVTSQVSGAAPSQVFDGVETDGASGSEASEPVAKDDTSQSTAVDPVAKDSASGVQDVSSQGTDSAKEQETA